MNTVSSSRPRHVTIAVAILCVMQISGLVSVLSHVDRFALIRRTSTNSVYATALLGVCIGLFLIFKIFNRRNWARIAYLAFSVLAISLTVFGFFSLVRQQNVWTVFDVFSSLADVVALVLLFTSSSNRWFKQAATQF